VSTTSSSSSVAGAVPVHWQLSICLSAVVTAVAAVNYTFMKDIWLQSQVSPTLFRYLDWQITVPIQMLEFFFCLSAAVHSVNRNKEAIGWGFAPALGNDPQHKNTSAPQEDIALPSNKLFFRLLIATEFMLWAGLLGEQGTIPVWLGFVLGMLGWVALLGELFFGEASRVASRVQKRFASTQSYADISPSSNNASDEDFKTSILPGNDIHPGTACFWELRLLVAVGWCLYPLGYFILMLTGPTVFPRDGTTDGEKTLNIMYNLADVVNKGFFGLLVIRAAARDQAKNVRESHQITVRQNSKDSQSAQDDPLPVVPYAGNISSGSILKGGQCSRDASPYAGGSSPVAVAAIAVNYEERMRLQQKARVNMEEGDGDMF